MHGIITVMYDYNDGSVLALLIQSVLQAHFSDFMYNKRKDNLTKVC